MMLTIHALIQLESTRQPEDRKEVGSLFLTERIFQFLDFFFPFWGMTTEMMVRTLFFALTKQDGKKGSARWCEQNFVPLDEPCEAFQSWEMSDMLWRVRQIKFLFAWDDDSHN